MTGVQTCALPIFKQNKADGIKPTGAKRFKATHDKSDIVGSDDYGSVPMDQLQSLVEATPASKRKLSDIDPLAGDDLTRMNAMFRK